MPYKHLEVVGVLPRRVPLATSGPNYTVQMDYDFLSFKHISGIDTSQIEKESTYERVRALEKNAWISIDKCDVGPFDLDGDPIFNKVLHFMDILMEPLLRVTPNMGPYDLKMSASPGLPYTLNKLKTKQDALKSPIYFDLASKTDYIPVASIATKDEFLPMEDLERDKVRTTFSTPLELILKSKLFFENQNSNIKAASDDMWIQYGMTKQYGGLDRVFQKIATFSHVVQSDASGYDRTAYLYWVYYLRWKHLYLIPECDEVLWHVIFHSIFPFCVCPDGTVFMRQTGNNSGANNTAADNSILHQMIVLYLLIYAYKKKYGEYPDLEEILENAYVPIYSDDKIGGINFEFFGWDNEDDYRRDEIHIYSLFNMTIKPSSVLVTEVMNGRVDPRHEFLGSSAAFSEEFGRYYGYPRIGKICSSVTRLGLNKLNFDQKFWKLLSLLSLSVAEPWLFDFIRKYIDYMIKISNQPTHYRDLLQEYGGESAAECMRLHIGFESRQCLVFNRENLRKKADSEDLCFNLFFFLKPGKILVEGGFKNLNMNRVTRGEKLLSEMVNQDKLSPSGRDWLIGSMDPFHDTQLKNLTGWPDMETGASVVRCVKNSIQISKPAGLAAGNWDMHVVMWPMLTNNGGTSCSMSLNTRTQNVVNGPAYPVIVNNQIVGGVQVYGTPPNGNLDILAPGGAGNTNYISTVNLNTVYTQGAGRLIGIGFEVHNTTAELTRQGSCTVYRQQACSRDPETFLMNNAGTTPYSGAFSGVPVRYPPRNASEAVLLAGGRTWESEKGCYVVGAFNSIENPAFPASTTQPYILTSGNEDYDGTLNGASMYVAVPKNVIGGQPVLNPQRVHPIHLSGAIFNGCSETSTFQLNVNYIYEAFPGLGEVDLVPLANPSCQYDPCALEIYSRVISYMPVGVPVDMNGMGEWFLDAVGKAAQFVGPLLTQAPHPIAKGAGMALTYLGNTALAQNRRPKNDMQVAMNTWKPVPKALPPLPALPPGAKPQKKKKKKSRRAARAARRG